MLSPDEIEALGGMAQQLTQPITDFLIGDIAERIAEAGQLTGTAAYEVWQAQQMGLSQKELKKKLQRLLKLSEKELEALFTKAAKASYNGDISRFPTVDAIPFGENGGLQQILKAAIELAQEDFTNITQTMGFVTPNGTAVGLTEAYRQSCDYAFQKVVTGAQDFTSAIREATRGLAEKGILRLDYESGVHTSMEAAVRRSVMGGLGLLDEKITRYNHDELGCDGWEISAHMGSAPDHEPFQGKQYADARYEVLNNSLRRWIGTLNCGHAAMPIILGVNEPQYTDDELEEMRRKNAEGITYEGRHMTLYEATQRQRTLERQIRKQKRRILVDEKTGDEDKLQTDQIRYRLLEGEYKKFSKAAGLRLQHERMEMPGFGAKQAVAAEKEWAMEQEVRYVAKTEQQTPSANSNKSSGNQALNTNAIKPRQDKQASPAAPEDVLEEYTQNATPGIGEIAFDEGYSKTQHANEVKVAQWLHDNFGGDIRLLNESSVPGEKMPDYLWREKLWDLKNLSTAKAADSALRGGLKQIAKKPGGIIFDCGENEIDLDEIISIISRRIRRKDNQPVDIIIISNGEVKKVIRYKNEASPRR